MNKFPFPNKTALKYMHTFVTRTSMIAFDHNFNGRFTFERIHNTKEQIIFYERAEKHKSKERTILSFKRALSPGNDQVVTSQVIMK